MSDPDVCPRYHAAVELIGRRWSGAIIAVLITDEPLRFSEVAGAIPNLSDRMLAARMAELERHGLVERRCEDRRVEYALTEMGRDLQPAVDALQRWGQRWLSG